MTGSTVQKYPDTHDTNSNNVWSKTPSFILRQNAIVDVIKHWQPGSFLETGIGTGTMTKMLLDRGYTGFGFDIAKENIQTASQVLEKDRHSIVLLSELNEATVSPVEYLFAFEVLEHIENDLKSLSDWSQYLVPGGKLLISVPARMKNYREDDQFVGHIRRYEKDTLKKLFTESGFENIEIISYGVPLLNVSRRIGAMIHKSQTTEMESSMTRRSIESGVSRSSGINALSSIVNQTTMQPWAWIQRFFYTFDIGEGYIATATKKYQATTDSELGC